MANTGEDEAETYAMIDSPQFFMDTPDSAESVREGGLASTVIETVFIGHNCKPCKLLYLDLF